MPPMSIFMHRLFHFRPYKPRNPLLRLGIGLIGLALLAVLVVVGLFVGLGMLLFSAIRRMAKPRQPVAPAQHMDAIDGEFTVVNKQQPASVHADAHSLGWHVR